MGGSRRKKTYAMAYTGIEAQGQTPVPVNSEQGVPQQLRLRLKKQVVTLRVGTWNVGTMTGKGKGVLDVMERRKVEILRVQQTKWKGNSVRHLGNGYKPLYAGSSTKVNGVGIILSTKMAEKVVEVERF